MRLLVILFLLANSSWASTRLLVLTENMPPYNYPLRDKIVGSNTALVVAMLKEAEVDYELHVLPWNRGYNLTKTQKNTLLFSTVKSQARTPLFKWIGPLHTESLHFYKLKNRPDIQVNSIEDLAKYKVAVPDEDLALQRLKKTQFDASKVAIVINSGMMLPILFRGSIDLVSLTPSILAHKLKRFPEYSMDELESVHKYYDEMPFYIAVNAQTEDALVNALQRALDKVVAEKFSALVKR